jgi:hypothetical protein
VEYLEMASLSLFNVNEQLVSLLEHYETAKYVFLSINKQIKCGEEKEWTDAL